MAKEPSLGPGDIYQRLYEEHDQSQIVDKESPNVKEITEEDLERAAQCGRWGPTKPSTTFLRIYHDVLCTLDVNVAQAVVSPPLLGTCGVMPLTILSIVPDIMRHMSNLIVRAEKEIVIATNYWIFSVASRFVNNALKELSHRAQQRNQRIVMKASPFFEYELCLTRNQLIYDRGSPLQIIENHLPVSEQTYTSKEIGLPPSEEIPNIDIQAINYHRPVLGTFHAKFMIVDRKFAVVQSNNIQACLDNPNLEMACQLEGPIVDSLYDMMLISWCNKLEPPPPSISSPAAAGAFPARSMTINLMPKEHSGEEAQSCIHMENGGTSDLTPKQEPVSTSVSPRQVLHPEGNAERGGDFRTESYLSTGESAIPQAQIEHPSTDNSLEEHTVDDPHYDADIAGEVARVQSSVSPKPGLTRVQAVTRHLNHTVSPDVEGDAPDCLPEEEMTPYIPHPTHEAFPMALVNRYPFGPLTHSSLYTPQNQAWISALRHAKKNVFIQSPNINAEPLLAEILSAVRRGIDVYCYVCLGYNDSGELLPRQGGTNEMVAHKLFTTLKPEHHKNLHWYWYVAKDMMEPIVAKKKQRTCHIKLMIVDEHIGIQGSGNQDTQSWFHSQEVNVMFDSEMICRAWIDGLRRNQNTHLYGEVSQEDGIWRDKAGNQAKDVIGVNPGKFSWAKGLLGAIERVRGQGGF
ncbi:SubName: Full=Uncharacterized protein {ECO:0000313/EMBL:EQB58197.1} [Serendipita indica DSM 11827]|nr:SubName: Full=Uncharacterized protein {ECO:0000313/EMBL:EQB58197.1} [Serendipita indica DSM 11827]